MGIIKNDSVGSPQQVIEDMDVCAECSETHIRLCMKCHFPCSSINLLSFASVPRFGIVTLVSSGCLLSNAREDIGHRTCLIFPPRSHLAALWLPHLGDAGLQDRWEVLRAPCQEPSPSYQLPCLLQLSSSPNSNSPQI